MVEHLEREVKLETKKHAGGETLQVRNDLYAPVEVELRIRNPRNAVGVPDGPIRWVVPARSQVRLATLAPRKAGKPMSYTPKLRYALGDPRQQPLLYRYPLPWRGGRSACPRAPMASTATSPPRAATRWTSPCPRARRSSLPAAAPW